MRSYWLQQALGAEDEDVVPLSRDIRTDVCIVGGGFTGLWTALEIKARDSSADVTIVEADICGGGASGRNGGFVMTWMSKAGTLLETCGGQEGVRLLRASEDGVAAIGAFCVEHGIHAEFRHDGWLWTASNDAQMGAWDDTVERLEAHGLRPFEVLERDALAALGGCARHVGGILERGVATVQPALLARGLRRVALERGVRIHEGTAMTGLEGGATPRVRTHRGTVTADAVVLALNAWAHELPVFRRSVLPVAADMVITERVGERLRGTGLATGLAVSDSRLLVNFYRSTPDGRLAFGKGGGAIPFAGRLGRRFDNPSAMGDALSLEIRRFGSMPGTTGVFYGHGYTGNGVGPTRLGGKILASLALGLDDEWSSTPLVEKRPKVFVPVEPVRYLGAQVVRAAAKRKERAEDAGGSGSWIDRKLAGLAPKGLAPVKNA
jgi:glycine/D-amino acid oxidase-like deaminating enzyme